MNTNCKGRRWLVLVLLFVVTGCDWLISQDHTPPLCTIISPADSALVSGTEIVQATATDSLGVLKVDFYVDDVLTGTDTLEPYTFVWSTAGLAQNSWHRLVCKATDYNRNVGTSNTVNVQVYAGGQRSVVHGQFDIDGGYFLGIGFTANAGDTLAGDVLVTAGGALSTFMWLDRQNYAAFRGSSSYSSILRQDNFTSLSVRQAVPASDSFYLVYLNSGTSTRRVWTRFVLE